MVSWKRKARKEVQKAGLRAVPQGAHVIPIETKKDYDTIPFHVFYPNPYDAITVLRSKKNPHDWLVCGWYLDTYREGEGVKGLVYKRVSSDAEKEAVITELKKHDKGAAPRFSL